MGVPGDMNLELLDYIKQVEGLQWGEYLPSTHQIFGKGSSIYSG